MGLRLDEFSDRELLALIADLRDEAGYVQSLDIAVALNLGEGGKQSASVRLSWMRRYGVVDYDDGGWCLTDDGERALQASASKGLTKAVEATSDPSLLEATHLLAERRRRAGSVFQTLSRREWQRELRRGT
jgi:hypothetical protein